MRTAARKSTHVNALTSLFGLGYPELHTVHLNIRHSLETVIRYTQTLLSGLISPLLTTLCIGRSPSSQLQSIHAASVYAHEDGIGLSRRRCSRKTIDKSGM